MSKDLLPVLWFDSVNGYWKNHRGEYDDEANDDRPSSEKYGNYWGVLIILIVIDVFLIWFVMRVLDGLTQ